jgi:hypothetical protein
MNFNDIMQGFIEAQMKHGHQAGLEYLNGVNAALSLQLSAPSIVSTLPNVAMKGFGVSQSLREENNYGE